MNEHINTKNIVLIGMSGVGKTSVGKYIAEELRMKFIDTDDIIIFNSGKTIKYIFDKYGEEYFRTLEKEVIDSTSMHKEIVISTGGGVVLSSLNIDILKTNGIIFLLEANLNTICNNIRSSISSKDHRPLLEDSFNLRNKIEGIYRKRKNLYLSSADHVVSVDDRSIEDIGDEIINTLRSLYSCG